MSDKVIVKYGSGMSVFGWTFIVFLVLKLCNVINWSWWWITAPLWGGVAIVAGLFVIFLVLLLVFAAIAALFALWSGRCTVSDNATSLRNGRVTAKFIDQANSK